MKAEREEPQPRERKLDIAPPPLAEIDQRIVERIPAEHELMIEVVGEVVAELRREWVVGATGPPGPAGPRGEQGPPGKLPLVKLWMPETVYYAGDVVAYDGGAFQAMCDTGQPPSHAHWICLAAAGRDGKTIAMRGTFNETAEHHRLDLVVLNGGRFIVLKDAPGPCPGSGWQLLASQGKRGAAGEKGERGPPGPRGDVGARGGRIRDGKIAPAPCVAPPVRPEGSDGPPLELR